MPIPVCGVTEEIANHILTECPKVIPIFCLKSFPFSAGAGKTSLVNLIVKGSSTSCPPQTIGCTVGVKITATISTQHITYGSPGSSSSSLKGDAERDFFIELWDVSRHEQYKDCRNFLNHSLRTKTSLQQWAAEIAATGTFSVPLSSGGPAGLPVPYIVIGNKADIAATEGTRGSSGNLVDVARQCVEKQGFLSSSEELPLTESFPGSGRLISVSIFVFLELDVQVTFTAAKEARYDKEGLMRFFRMLIKRRYFPNDLSTLNTWSASPSPRTSLRLDENSNDDHRLNGDPYKYDMLPPLPIQHNLTPPPTFYPQQPVSATENYDLPRFSFTGSQEFNSSARSKRADINV
ncbi:putative WRKY DNA-binding protein 51 [Hibiscus syriacus]|uniref:WRKY DNA-binding protein 51 n=1 Tax=Hibiscus syriacus TaxID=106335 RepID=A0A6A2ZZD6_HIBSY|nr:putative WRKY DNA-binding protein 51 [Hibiscus syriacus]